MLFSQRKPPRRTLPPQIRREIEALPTLVCAPDDNSESAESVASATESARELSSPLQIVAKQGRLLLRLSAATEALDGRCDALVRQIEEQDDARRQAESRARQTALVAIQILDALDWVHMSLEKRGDPFARTVEAAQRDCVRRLAAAGVCEIPCAGLMDGRLHEALDTVSAGNGLPPYHIARVVRRGFQSGTDVLRRAGVVTVASAASGAAMEATRKEEHTDG